VCLPASIDNNLPGSELAIGADTALNVITEAVDRIKMSGSAAKRAFVVETMGRYCGYLALMGALAGGAERVYLHEEGISLTALVDDLEWLRNSFASGRKLFLAIRNENANPLYTTDFLARLLEQEGQGLYDVRQNILGHIQQGGCPSPFDRLLAVRLVSRALDLIGTEFASGTSNSWYLGLVQSKVTAFGMSQMTAEMDLRYRRPKEQWWLALRPVMKAVADAAV
jgi:6-phosphofructokinase 1